MTRSKNNSKPAPVIKFLGLFDTVRQSTGKLDLELTENVPIHHIRHALALNEERHYMEPEIEQTHPVAGRASDWLIQAWFVGWHGDIGGGARDDGLSLYPLQWMLLECQRYKLVLEVEPKKWIQEHMRKNFKVLHQHPPALVLPSIIDETGVQVPVESLKPLETSSQQDVTGKSSDGNLEAEETPFQEWRFDISNGVKVIMYDLRATHRNGNLQEWKGNTLRKRNSQQPATHRIQLNPPASFLGVWAPRGNRSVFDSKSCALLGYRNTSMPSLVLHTSLTLSLTRRSCNDRPLLDNHSPFRLLPEGYISHSRCWKGT